MKGTGKKKVRFWYSKGPTFLYILTYLFKGNLISDVKLSSPEAYPGSWQCVCFVVMVRYF